MWVFAKDLTYFCPLQHLLGCLGELVSLLLSFSPRAHIFMGSCSLERGQIRQNNNQAN